VAVVYEHALLGEGVAHLLRSATGAEVVVVPATDAQALTRALALEPAVVLVECATLLAALDLGPAQPRAVVIELLVRPGTEDPLRARQLGVAEMIEAVRVALTA
jgi:DNA-binding NarL/FixJ family response regulator